MVGSAVNISQHDVHMIRESHLRPEIGQHMYPFLVLVSLPISDILISHARIFIRPMIDQHMDTRLQLDIPQGIINRFALYPKPRQRIPFGKFTRILVILEEANIIQLYGQLPGLLRRYDNPSYRHDPRSAPSARETNSQSIKQRPTMKLLTPIFFITLKISREHKQNTLKKESGETEVFTSFPRFFVLF